MTVDCLFGILWELIFPYISAAASLWFSKDDTYYFSCLHISMCWLICENIGSRSWDLWYTSFSLEDFDVIEELYVWYLLVIWAMCTFLQGRFFWCVKTEEKVVCCLSSLFGLGSSCFSQNLPKGEIVGYLYVGFNFA